MLHPFNQFVTRELDASVKGWINHVRYADTWGLRRHVFRALPVRAPGDR